ncbi:MAG: tRNA lysidine(34) synthetase TilS [Hymenobacteraceae bacterium]|nr:tRNA lysidine(34) synthetase TilS [Hymenobacteraceae bacterium]MDX5395518.1 tRNA lysidine(34) synthetase TilS [Hymenobacteraceae bacterium]MDX5443377.1 tRNA lysidine(34) synthetase TilS [Hymenobacteraceae bacterium]MDX5511572.1 tRNA lysidine(34) synthetase TilS [Hymenobacteraceae bacterium]
MLQKVSDFIQDHKLCQPQERILAAVSGGIDSVVLCEVLHQLKYDFGIAHCNFNLRGEESMADELFVKKLAKKYKVPYYSDSFETKEYAEQEKISIQMAARILRYNWFEKLRHQHQYDHIATAHHLNDTAETILLNLVRGTGIAGLHGIAAKNGAVIRPLLALQKDEIFDFVVENQLIWREDSSNENTKYQRNLIRHEVIPILKQLNPNLETTLQHTTEKITGAEQIYHAYIDEVKNRTLRIEGQTLFIDLQELKNATAVPVVLFEMLKPFHFNFAVVKEIIEAFDAISGKTFESPTHLLVKDREQLVLTQKNLAAFRSEEIAEGQQELQTEQFTYTLEVKDATDYHIPINTKIAALDADLLKYPLKLRRWKEGDWFIPLGMKGKKKISDFLIDTKVPANLKPNVLVLTSEQSIVWVVGQRLDNRFKITDKTERVLEIRLS